MCIAPWVMEAHALEDMGMPHGAFTLASQCDSILGRTRRAFGLAQSDAAWQAALEAYSNDDDKITQFRDHWQRV
jgi:hypothetical protein